MYYLLAVVNLVVTTRAVVCLERFDPESIRYVLSATLNHAHF